MTSLAVLVLMLWLPGSLLRRAFGIARGRWGTGLIAVEATLSLGFLSFVLLPVYLAAAPVALGPLAVLASFVVLFVAALPALSRQVQQEGTRSRTDVGGAARMAPPTGAGSMEMAAFAAAVAVLLPATLSFSGANVDDWWDLSFVSGWLADGHFGFRQMALSPEPAADTSAFHPRFLWSVWLMLQTIVAYAGGEQPWRMQATAFAATSIVLVVSAQAALARALFRERAHARLLVAATVAMTAAWVWGTDALPLFVRGYQDKLFAGFVLAPVLLAFAIDASRTGTASSSGALAHPRPDVRRHARAQRAMLLERRAATAATALAAVALVSVHSLVFTMAAFVCVLAWAARHGKDVAHWLLRCRGMAAALLVPALYPVLQAVMLSGKFGEQGISLATRDNPVVRAHLSLNRLVGDATAAWVVHPGAVFGPVALLGSAALVIAWRRRGEDSSRMLLVLALVPGLLLFVPGLAALAGTMWVPWMLYRLGWMIPVAPMLAFAVVSLATAGPRHRIAAALLAGAAVLLASSTATDRLRRDMHEHPGQPTGPPTAAAAAIYDSLAIRAGRAAVLAPPNFSELVPALSGKPVVAFSERGTLVFSRDETSAYERLRDRARFFASSTTPSERDAVAARYGARWAVLPRTLVASGSEAAWIGQFGPEALLAARAADAAAGAPCEGEWCHGWWSATAASAAAGLPTWSLVRETRDYFLFERAASRAPEGAGAHAEAPAREPANREEGQEPAGQPANPIEAADPGTPRWLRPFAVTPPASPPLRADVLGAAAGAPGAVVTYDIPPRFVLPSVAPIWLDGPGAWEDAPAEVSVRLDLAVACTISAVELVPHLPRERRDVLEASIDDGARFEQGNASRNGSVVRSAARHGVAIVVPVGGDSPRTAVTVHVRSLVGSPVSLADIRVLGDRSTCAEGWPSLPSPQTAQMTAREESLLSLAASQPSRGRPFVSLARLAARTRGQAAAVPLLVEATKREPSLVEGWLELGFANDAIAASAASPQQAAAASTSARRAFEAAVTADSHNAWAQGCAAWSAHRAGQVLPAIRHALAAAQLDPMYGDAWTILGHVLGDLRLYSLAESAIDLAQRADPDRNWPVLARADVALARRDAGADAAVEAARTALRAWISRHPFDLAARGKLSQIGEATSRNDAGGAGSLPAAGQP